MCINVEMICLPLRSVDLQAFVLKYAFTSINFEWYLIFMLKGREGYSNEFFLQGKRWELKNYPALEGSAYSVLQRCQQAVI